MVKCNNCSWVGNNEDLTKLWGVDGAYYTKEEINSLNLNDDITEDMCDGCPRCKSDEYLADIEYLSDFTSDLIDGDLIGSEWDSDQIFKQIDCGVVVVAGCKVNVDNEVYNINICNRGEQRVYISLNESGELIPIDDGKEVERLLGEPKLLIEAHRLQRESGKEYVDYAMNCWIDIDVYRGEEFIFSYYDCFGSVYSSISEAVRAIEPHDIKEGVKAVIENV